jgi:pyroglutamyl-peptidase
MPTALLRIAARSRSTPSSARSAAEGIPAAPSRDAGGFLCNHVFYVLMRTLETHGGRGGFVHVPLLPEQALDKNSASMPLATLVRAAQIIVEAVR